MTKEQIKFFIDNQETIFDEIYQRLESLGQEIDLPDDISAENIRYFYDECYKNCSDIFDKYNMDYDAFTTILAISEGDKSFREQILGRDEANQLLRDIIDIYGDEAYDVLGCNSYGFEMSEIDGILSGENNPKYEEFYTKLLNEKCEKAYNLKQLSDILLSTKPEYINQGLIESFLKNPDKMISDLQIKEFIDTAPAVITSGSSVKLLVDRVESDIHDASILEQIPPELFDEEFSKRLLEKSTMYAFSDVFKLIPEESKNIDIWEFAISKNNWMITSLPDKKIDENMTDEEYSKWCEDLVIDVLRNNPDDIQGLFRSLRDVQKTLGVCNEGAKLLQAEGYEVEKFLESIPESSRTRQIYETLLEKSEYIIKHIPEVSFEEGLSQEEYETWVDDIITKKISQMKNVDSLYVPREKRTEKVWNALLDKCNKTNGDKSHFGLSYVPIQNITMEMCERALKDISDLQITDIPSIDRKLDTITNNTDREEYEKWIAGFSEKEKELYREWYESKVIDFIKEKQADVFIDKFENRGGRIKIPPEAISLNIINAYLQEIGPTGIERIPTPSALTNYNEQYEDIVVSAISMLEGKNYLKRNGPGQALVESWDVLDKIPEEYRTDKVVLEAIKKHPKYLDYADFENENFNELLQIGYKSKLESIGRTELSEQEIELMKKFAKNNSSLFSTLNLDIFNPDIINSIGENSLEKIVRYTDVQYSIIELAKAKEALTTFGFALENLKQDNLFIEPLIEQLSNSIISEEISVSKSKPSEFLKLASNRIQDKLRPLTEEEKTIISYLALNPSEANKIQSYDEILNFVANKNAELDEIINSKDSTLIDAKNAYLQRIVGMNYASVVDLVMKYGNDPEDLLAKYEGKELGTYKEKAEKEALEIVIKLKSLIEEKDLSKIQETYLEAVEKENTTKAFERYKQATMLDNTLRRSYGRDITQTLNEHNKENNVESVEHTEDGQEYLVRKMNGPFNRMISVMNAYRKSAAEAEGDMYDRWNTSAMAGNHALCYSFINESNPGTAPLGDKKGVIISISGFDAEAVTATAPYDLCSDSRKNTTVTWRQQRFYTANNLPDQTRGGHSEVDIEIQDVSEGVTEYKKIQPTSIICFEEVDEDSIKAAIELSKKLGRTIPIELIDRRELANQTRQEIDNLLNEFKNGESLQPELIGQIITKFNNVRNAHMDSNLADELLGEKNGNENPDAIFNKAHLNEMLSECIEIDKQRIEKGEIQEGLETIAQIKQFIREEREKNVLQPTMYEKQIIAGIDLDVDYRLDELQRMYGTQEISTDTRNTTLEILQGRQELDSPTFETMHGKNPDMPEQLSFAEFQDNIDISEIQITVQEIHQKGYYSENKSYSEEHIARVAMFSSAIANLEGADDKTKRLLQEAVKYHSCRRMLDIAEEQHQEYSAKIAGQELSEKYSETDVGIVQAAIELQNLRYSSSKTDKMENERKEKVSELCEKYGLDISNGERIDCIAKYIEDSVNLDKARFVTKTNNPPGEEFSFYSLKTDTARKLVKASYCIQDELSTEHLKEMSKVATIDFEAETDTIMKEFFTKKFRESESRIYDESIVKSPIVREAYLKHRFHEIDFEGLMEVLTKQEKTDLTTDLPIASGCIEDAKKIAESRIARNVTKTSQEVKTGYIEMENPNQNRETTKEQI